MNMKWAWPLLLAAGCGGSGSGSAANGTIVSWSSSSSSAQPALPKPRANHCSAAANGRLYVLGGNYKPMGAMDFIALDDVEVADQQAGGALAAFRQAGTLPSAL